MHAAPRPAPVALEELLSCPQCLAGVLHRTAAGWACVACAARFPEVGGVPWLFAEPGARLAEWRQRFQLVQQEHAWEHARVVEALRDEALSAVTRGRLQRLADGHAAQPQLLRALLAPIEPDAAIARYETLLALRTRTPLSQDLNSYYPNLHRDWVWGQAENEAAFELVRELAGAAAPGRTLIVGAGAGRLAYDIHERLGPSVTVALDINPLLLLCAERVARGGVAGLYEFPLAPRTAGDVALLRELRAPRAARAGLEFIFGDALRAPFRPGAFDTIVTPWFIDIVPQEPAEVAARLNELLAPGGRWLNFGSLNFPRREPALRYSPEELPALLAAGGFDVAAVTERTLPYLQSPASRHGRIETVFAFCAMRQRAAAPVPRSGNLPAWIADPQLPVPLLPYFESRALANRIYAFVMALIDGRRGIAQIAAYLVEQKLMLPGEAEAAVRSFLATLHEEARTRDRF
jgi:SAM-dependent methyltransferase